MRIIVNFKFQVAVQVLCSYITLPLYALVTQMGTNMKKSIFDEQTSRALKNWHRAAVKKKKDEKSGKSPRTTPSASPMQSPVHPLHRFQTTGHSTRSSFTSRRYSETDLSDVEGDNSPTSSTANLIAHMDNGDLEIGTNDQSYDTRRVAR
ncbi:Mlo-like protein [Thalictrum thalictroides]|uniref:Mlo-like protein n=1 Tax=Thalictrum thalictroides TaxID=46969 RepID=A0A7J6UXI8_THATH|nr:Mlo-like protein [Thalictrum thalictroides]